MFSKAGKEKRAGVRRLIFSIIITFSVLTLAAVVSLVFMMVNTSGRYTDVLRNAKTAADFNKEFKNTLDSEMYNHVIRPGARSRRRTCR